MVRNGWVSYKDPDFFICFSTSLGEDLEAAQTQADSPGTRVTSRLATSLQALKSSCVMLYPARFRRKKLRVIIFVLLLRISSVIIDIINYYTKK